jgi:hypothetical protein
MTADVVVAGQLARDLVPVVEDVPEPGRRNCSPAPRSAGPKTRPGRQRPSSARDPR